MSGRRGLGSHRASTCASRAHSTGCHHNGLWSRRVCRCRSFELDLDSGRGHRSGDFIVSTATTEINNIGVVRVVQDPQKVALVQAFAIAAEEIARRAANLQGGDCGVPTGYRRNCAPDQVERFVSRES